MSGADDNKFSVTAEGTRDTEIMGQLLAAYHSLTMLSRCLGRSESEAMYDCAKFASERISNAMSLFGYSEEEKLDLQLCLSRDLI